MQDIEGLKRIQLDILLDIDKICRENNLKYYLVGGTLLGAVRHKGFIPWDDDIDIGMPREDLNKLEEIIINQQNDKYFVQNPKTDKQYLRYITKIRKNGTTLVEEAVEKVDMNHGVYIDIFPLDRISNKNDSITNMRAYMGKLGRNLKRIKVVGSSDSGFKPMLNKILASILPISVLNRFIELMYQSGNKGKNQFYTNFGSKYGWKKQTFPVDVYGEGTFLDFEEYKFLAPKEWDTILKSLYGDYLKVPSDDNKVSGHKIVELDLGEK